jgi:hypothetical protein
MVESLEVIATSLRLMIKLNILSPALTDINLEAITYTVKMADLTTYCISSTSHMDMTGTLVDWGANSGITRSDCRIIKV